MPAASRDPCAVLRLGWYHGRCLPESRTGSILAQPEQNVSVTLRDYWRVVWLRRRLVIVVIIVCALLPLGRALMQPKVYSATATLMYNPPANVSSAVSGASTDVSRLNIDVQNVINTINSPAVSAAASESMVGNDAAQKLSVAAAVSVPANATSVSVADVIQITAQAGTPSAAARIANAYAKAVITLRKENEQGSWRAAQQIIQGQLDMYKTPESKLTSDYAQLSQQLRNLQIAEASANGDFEIIIPASPPSAPVSPKPVKSAVFGGVVGVFVGVMLAFVVEQFDTRVRSYRTVSQILGLSVMGRVPRMTHRMLEEGGLVAATDPEGSVSEALRVLRRNLEWSGVDATLKSVVVTSLMKGEGKTLTLCNLAVTLARGGSKVIVVDADLRAPQVHRVFDLPNVVGLTNVVFGKVELRRALREVKSPDAAAPLVLTKSSGRGAIARAGAWVGSLQVLTSGPLPPNAGEVMASRSAAEMLAELALSDADFVLIDTPPLLGFGDAGAISPAADGVLLTVRIDKARRPVLEDGREALDALPGRKIGVVIVGERVDHTQMASYASYSSSAQ
jgi:Mrp family chromosome partitioning ATPase/capsular polysaccharide biosynthesis protein